MACRRSPQHPEQEAKLCHVDHHAEAMQRAEPGLSFGIACLVDLRRHHEQAEKEQSADDDINRSRVSVRLEYGAKQRHDAKRCIIFGEEGADVCAGPLLRQHLEDGWRDRHGEEQHDADDAGNDQLA